MGMRLTDITIVGYPCTMEVTNVMITMQGCTCTDDFFFVVIIEESSYIVMVPDCDIMPSNRQ